MDLKDRRHRSLTRGRCSKDSQYNTASLDADECRVPTQKSYSSSETLKAFDHEQRLHYGGCVTDLVHHEAEEYSRQGGFVEQKPTNFFKSLQKQRNPMKSVRRLIPKIIFKYDKMGNFPFWNYSCLHWQKPWWSSLGPVTIRPH